MNSTSFSLSEYGSKAFPPPIPHRLESLRGPGDSNVVVRGFLLHGPHLGTSPSTMTQNLLPLLQAGVTCFVCMQQELPSVMTAQATQTRSTYGSNNVVTARPYIREAQALIDAPGSSLPNSGSPLSFVHCPIPPTGPGILDDESAAKLCTDLIAYMRAGELLYLHCSDGNGRSGTIACLLAGIAFNIGPVEAMSLMQKSRNDRGGSQGPCPETHEQRMQVHRLLSDAGFRSRVNAASPKKPETQRNESNAALHSVLLKIRGIVAKKGIASLVYLRRYAIKLGHAAIVESGGQAPPPPSPIDTGAGVFLPRRAFDKFCADSQWFLTPDESTALFSSAVSISNSNHHHRDMVEVAPFFKLVRGPLSARRAASVHAAFARLGGDLLGSVNVDAIAKAFSATLHPDVKANRRTSAEVTSEFLDTFGMQVRTEVKGSGVGARALGLPTTRSVSAQEFEDYYADLSGAITDDSYFDLVVFGCFPTAANHLLSAASQSHNKAYPHITASVGAASQADKRESIFLVAPPEKQFGGTLTFNGESRHSGRMRIQNAGTNQVAESGTLTATRPNTLGTISGGGGGGFSSGLRQVTDSGYSYVDRVTIESSLKALHARLVRVGPFAMSYLGAMFRRHDNDRDGLIDLFEFRAALKDTVIACASPNTGGGASSASVEHPLTVSDADSDAVFASAIQAFAPETANSQRPVIPLEKFHQCLRGPLSKSRRAAVLSLFTQLDRDASGCIPIGHLMQSFRAEGHPAVHAGKATVPSIYRQFQDSFGEAFKYEDSAGAAGARFDPGAAGEAYKGYGDGTVRLPFFESWNEGISSLVGGGPSTNGEPFPSDTGSDNDFNLVAFSVWQAARASSNALSGGSNGPAFDARAMLQKSDDTESGILSSMQKLGSASRAGGQANVSSTAFEIGAGPGTRVGIARQQHVAAQQQQLSGVAGSSLVIPPSARGGMAAAQPPQPPPSPSPAPYAAQAAQMIANRSTPNNSRFFSDELGVVTGGSGTNVGMRGGSRQSTTASQSSSSSAMMDPELDSAIRMGRSILQRRGFRGGFQLLRSIELASGAVNGGKQQQQQQQAPLGSAYLPIPQKMMVGIIRDSGLGLSNQQLDTVASRFSTPKAFLDALFPQLSPTRMDIVRRAFDAVCKQASAQNAIIDGSPALSVLQLSYLSARHPEVKSGKRSEEDVLREFLATFSGPTIVDGEGDNAIVTFDGFCTYYTIVSFFVIEDATFTTQLFDTWSLFSMPSTEGAAGLAYNLYGSGYDGLEGTGRRHSPKKEAEQRSSVSDALGQGPGYSRAMHLRGPGQDHPPSSAYQGGFGVENKRDFSAKRPGWGIERF